MVEMRKTAFNVKTEYALWGLAEIFIEDIDKMAIISEHHHRESGKVFKGKYL